ncbi:hypothetical protein [Streptomyces violens]|uniref:hypothetical protein n=1 Tax=Streptomyces violens TaxID=66377 RepID=UPI00068AA6DC|nr:hypothetical protein [Streptomyces violens]
MHEATTSIDAYTDAPHLLAEMTWVTDQVATHASGTRLSREFWLRKAALLDRLAIREAEEEGIPEAMAEADTLAARAAHRLAQYDRERGGGPFATSNGPIPPDSPLWDPSYRPYVRQEYAAWRRMTAA